MKISLFKEVDIKNKIPKIKWKFYKNLDSIMCSYLSLNRAELKETYIDNMLYHEFKKNFKNDAWGFYDPFTDTIHIWWSGRNITGLLETISHELGHVVGKSYKNKLKDEREAQLYADVLLETLKVKKRITKLFYTIKKGEMGKIKICN